MFLTVAVIGLIGNVVSVWLLNAGKDNSLNVKTAFLHMLYDALSSVVVIGGGIVIILTRWYPIDTILSVAIALMIFWSSYLVIKEAIGIFLEAVPAAIDFDEVHRAIQAVGHVSNVHDLHIWSLSSTEIALSCHVSVGEKDYARGPQLIDRINRLLSERFGIHHATIQIELAECLRPDLLCNDEHLNTESSREQTR
ncbi:MAG: cation transporter [Candidatus Zixiibacteriota bacterium]|nr:MAG: cation transporter [candidate division Zixibacteria bacterium]